jgi:hypothetical protein
MEERMPRAKLATKRTVELDTLSIADRLDEIRTNLRIAALACDGLEDTSTGDNSAIANMIMRLESELEQIGDRYIPGSPKRRSPTSNGMRSAVSLRLKAQLRPISPELPSER